MILVNVFGKSIPLSWDKESITCGGVILFKGSGDLIKEKMEYYKYYGLSTQEQKLIQEHLKSIEDEKIQSFTSDQTPLYC